jgi:hypothetical protein
MRITKRYLKEWLIKEFTRLEINTLVGEVERSNFTGNQYEAGAWWIRIAIGIKPCITHLYIYYPLSYLQKELNNGYELFLDLKNGSYLNDAEINIRKKSFLNSK